MTRLAILEAWSQHIPPDHVHVITVPRHGPADLLWTRFVSVLGINPGGADLTRARTNSSLGLLEAEFLRRMNEALPGDVPDWFYTRNIKRVLAHDVLSAGHATCAWPCPPARKPGPEARRKSWSLACATPNTTSSVTSGSFSRGRCRAPRRRGARRAARAAGRRAVSRAVAGHRRARRGGLRGPPVPADVPGCCAAAQAGPPAPAGHAASVEGAERAQDETPAAPGQPPAGGAAAEGHHLVRAHPPERGHAGPHLACRKPSGLMPPLTAALPDNPCSWKCGPHDTDCWGLERSDAAAFIGHGTPMNALDRNRFTDAWRAFGASVPRPGPSWSSPRTGTSTRRRSPRCRSRRPSTTSMASC